MAVRVENFMPWVFPARSRDRLDSWTLMSSESYLTDTLPHSSGSPVFNSEWEVVALHHAGVQNKKIGNDNFAVVSEA